MFVEGWVFLDALYMTTIVITTIGFQEVVPLDASGKVFTTIFAMICYLFLAGIISIMSSILFDIYFNKERRYRRMLQKIKNLKDHVVVCASGNLMKYIVEELIKMHVPFVLLGADEDIASVKEQFEEDKLFNKLFHALEGDPTNEEFLMKAGITYAKGLICALSEDSQNLFIAMSANSLNPRIRITSYVIKEVNTMKFDLVGVHDIVSGDYIIGRRLATSLEDKNISLFLDQAAKYSGGNLARQEKYGAKGKDPEMLLGDAILKLGSELIGKTLKEAALAERLGVLIIAARRRGNNKFHFNPNPDFLLKDGDVLISMGSLKQNDELKKLGMAGPKVEV
jgi:voltage-gated potassium channel